jgi:hypothetical protein
MEIKPEECIMKNSILLPLLVILLGAFTFAQNSAAETTAQPTSAATQSSTAPNQAQAPSQFAPNTEIPAELSKSLDAKKIKVGDPVEAKTTVDMLSNGHVITPRNSRVLGHVTSVKAHSKESPDSTLGIAFDRLVMKDGRELPLQASLQAIGPPINAFAGAAMAGLQPANPAGSAASPGSTGGGQRSGGGSSSSGSSTRPSSSPGMPSGPDGSSHDSSGGSLSVSSEGVVGMTGLSLTASPQASVISSSNKNVHLDGGTQLILRVQ